MKKFTLVSPQPTKRCLVTAKGVSSSFLSLGAHLDLGMEFLGEVFAEVLGLNRSSYQWVIDSVEHDERVSSILHLMKCVFLNAGFPSLSPDSFSTTLFE